MDLQYTNPNASVKDKLDAINSDIALNITLMKLEYEVAYLSRIAEGNPSREYIFLLAWKNVGNVTSECFSVVIKPPTVRVWG